MEGTKNVHLLQSAHIFIQHSMNCYATSILWSKTNEF